MGLIAWEGRDHSVWTCPNTDRNSVLCHHHFSRLGDLPVKLFFKKLKTHSLKTLCHSCQKLIPQDYKNTFLGKMLPGNKEIK